MTLREWLYSRLMALKKAKFEDACKGIYRIGDSVLDVGAGDCIVAEHFNRVFEVEMTCIDVVDINQTSLELVRYDGRRFPFGDETFDVVNLFFVLHHCDDPVEILSEAKRVTRDKVVVFEDTYRSRAGRLICSAMDMAWGWNWCNVPLNFKKKEEWNGVFSELGLRVEYSKVKRTWYYPVTHLKYVLQKTGAAVG